MSWLRDLFSSNSRKPRAKDVAIDNDMIYPWVRLNCEVGEQETLLTMDLVEAPLFGDLFLLYVLDKGNEFEVLQRVQFTPELNLEEFHARAVENFRKDIEFKVVEPQPHTRMVIVDGNQEAGVLCLPEFWPEQAAELGDDLYVAVPSKDVEIFTGRQDLVGYSNVDDGVERVSALEMRPSQRLGQKRFIYSATTAQWSVEEPHIQHWLQNGLPSPV